MSPPAGHNNKVQLEVVVNGTGTALEANIHEPLRAIIPKALEQTGNEGQPPENWELRDANGTPLPIDQKVEDFHFEQGTKLFLNLKAGIGG
jgi:hypothetical protein